jgi:hypothetical protein
MKIALATVLLVGSAHADYTQTCLNQHGYTPDQFQTYSFEQASRCADDFVQRQKRAERAQEREFVLANPWYRGSNWRWEENVEYTCTRVISTKHTRNPVICSKPIRIN